MPKKETYGAQPPIEILRQYLDHKGWYNRRELVFMKLEELIFLTAMGPPGGGRSSITARMTRHFNLIAYTELDKEVIRQIFDCIVKFMLKRFEDKVKDLIGDLIEQTLQVYYTVRKDLLPTPSKSHYTFNLRDISKVFQGICSVSYKQCNSPILVVRCWYHENMRVFHDRLVDEEDREYLKNLLISKIQHFNGLTQDEVIDPSIERIIFADFMQGREQDPRHYIQVDDMY